MRKIFPITILIIAILAGVGVYHHFIQITETLTIQTPNGAIKYNVEIATTPEQQRTGLMFRDKLPPKTGMLFLFKSIRTARMWMKNTLIPLDMVFFDRFGYVTKVHYHAIPQDETVISSDIPVAGVLEINAGEALKYGILKGSSFDLDKFK